MNNKKIVFHCCTVYQLIVAIQVKCVFYTSNWSEYSHDEKENYGESTMAFVTKTAILDAMNHGMTEMLKKYSELVELNFLTKPHYVKI